MSGPTADQTSANIVPVGLPAPSLGTQPKHLHSQKSQLARAERDLHGNVSFFAHILLFFISFSSVFLSLPTLAQPFLIVFFYTIVGTSVASIQRLYIMFCKTLDMAAGLSYYCSTFHYVFYNVIWHNIMCERERCLSQLQQVTTRGGFNLPAA